MSRQEQEAEMFRWLTADKRQKYIWNHVLTDEEHYSGNTLEEVIQKAIAKEKNEKV